MFDLFDQLDEAIRQILIGFIRANLATMFTDVNEKTASIAAEVGQTPQDWNGPVFSMIQNLSDTVIVPIAGIVITFVLCYELISMVTERNNMHDLDTWMFFKWFFKAWIAVYLLTNTFDIVMAVFDVGQHLVSSAAAVIGHDTHLYVEDTIDTMLLQTVGMETPELLVLSIETMMISLCMKVMTIFITVILYGRMIEIYLYTSVAPIPFATFANREWGNIGNNYAKGLLALGIQGFFIMVCVGIYAMMINVMTISSNIHSSLFSIATYTVILCFGLTMTGRLSKQVLGAH